MTLDVKKYNNPSSIDLDEFKKLGCCYDIDHEKFVFPTPTEVKMLRTIMGFTQVDLAKLTGVSWNGDGSSSVRKWETVSGKESRKISKAAWRLMLIKVGLVKMKIDPIFN